MLEQYVRDVLGSSILFENAKEVIEVLKKYSIRFREWANRIVVEKADLLNLPENELEAILEKVRELDTSFSSGSIRNLIDSCDHTVHAQSSSNLIVLDSEQRLASQQSSKVLIRSNLSVSSRKLLEMGLAFFSDEDVKRILEAVLRAPRRKTTSLYIDVDLWEQFINTLEEFGIDKRKAHIVIELLIAKFLEQVKNIKNTSNEFRNPKNF